MTATRPRSRARGRQAAAPPPDAAGARPHAAGRTSRASRRCRGSRASHCKPRIDKAHARRARTRACSRSRAACRARSRSTSPAAAWTRPAARRCEYADLFGPRATSSSRCMRNGLATQAVDPRGPGRRSRARTGPARSSRPTTSTTCAPSDAEAQDVLHLHQHRASACTTSSALPHRDATSSTSAAARRWRTIFGEDSQALTAARPRSPTRCDIRLELGACHLPRFDIPGGEPAEACFRPAVRGGPARGATARSRRAVRERFENEKRVIAQDGLRLVLPDRVGPDPLRARAAASPSGPGAARRPARSWPTRSDITQLDPLRYDLLFERFLNADRISMPDIDIDFCTDRRERGHRVRARASTAPSSVAPDRDLRHAGARRPVIRDAGRVLDVPLPEIDKLAKMIPDGPNGAALEEARRGRQGAGRDVRRAASSCRSCSTSRCASRAWRATPRTHAAGVVITDRPLVELRAAVRGAGARSTRSSR